LWIALVNPHSLHNDRLVPLWADRNHLDRLANELADAAEIRAGVGGQVVETAAVSDFVDPTGQRFENGLGTAQVFDMTGEPGGFSAIDSVRRADFQRVESGKHV
jgi:hypothetical protein